MQITYTQDGDFNTIFLKGELDHHSAKKTREAMDDIISITKPSHLIIDLSDIGFMDSSGIGLVLGRYKLMFESGGSVEIITKTPSIKRIFEMAGVNKLLTVR